MILKHYAVKVLYNDRSRYQTTFDTQTDVMLFLETLTLTETETVMVGPVWSEPGEVVELKVHHQS